MDILDNVKNWLLKTAQNIAVPIGNAPRTIQQALAKGGQKAGKAVTNVTDKVIGDLEPKPINDPRTMAAKQREQERMAVDPAYKAQREKDMAQAEKILKPIEAVGDFGMVVARALPRTAAEVWNQIIGRENFTPEGNTQRLIYGDEPVDNIRNRFKYNKDFARNSFGLSDTSAELLAFPLTALGVVGDLTPAGGAKKAVVGEGAEKVAKIAASKNPSLIKGVLQTIKGVKFADNELEDLSKKLVDVNSAEEVGTYLKNYIFKGEGAEIATDVAEGAAKVSKYDPTDLNDMADFTDAILTGTKQVGPEESNLVREMASRYGIDPTLPDEQLAKKFSSVLDENWGKDFMAGLDKEKIGFVSNARQELADLNKVINQVGPNSPEGKQAAERITTLTEYMRNVGKEASIMNNSEDAIGTVLGRDVAETMTKTKKAVDFADKINEPRFGEVAQDVAETVIKASDEIPAVTVEQAAKLDPEQLRLFDIPEVERELSDELRNRVKLEIADVGKITNKTMEDVRDVLYGRGKIVDAEFAIKDQQHSYNSFKKIYESAGQTIPDDIAREHEKKMAERIISTVKGDVEKYKVKMKNIGIRDDVIKELTVGGEKLEDLVRVKREANGEISTVIQKSLLDELKGVADSLHLNKGSQWVKKVSIRAAKKAIGDAAYAFEVPQQFFKRVGLKEKIYDPIRRASRAFVKERKYFDDMIEESTKGMKPDELKDVTLYLAGQQGFAERMEKAGVKMVDFAMLNDKQKKLVALWNTVRSDLEPRVLELAKKHGKTTEAIENFFPMRVKRDIEKIGEDMDGSIDNMFTRKDPFFASLKERSANTPFDIYELDAKKLMKDYISGAERYVHIGKESLPLKYLTDSAEFEKLFGNEITGEIKEWLKQVTSPKSQLSIVEKVLSKARSAQYVATLGLNVKSAMKQLETLVYYYGMEGGLLSKKDPIAKQLSKEGIASVMERVPYIGMEDLQDKTVGKMLGMITWVDKQVAGNIATSMISKEIKAMRELGENVDIKDTKTMNKILDKIQDDLDLIMGGATPEQRPKVYRTEIGKSVFPFTSTVNSQFQWMLQKAFDIKKDKNGWEQSKRVAKIGATLLTAAYVDQAINNLSFGADDPAGTAKDMLKSTVGNLPVVSGLLFSMETGDYDAFAPDNSLADVIKNASNGKYGLAGWNALEAVGVPKQFRKTVQGLSEYGDLRHAIGGKYQSFGEEEGGGGSSSGGAFGGSGATQSGNARQMLGL